MYEDYLSSRLFFHRNPTHNMRVFIAYVKYKVYLVFITSNNLNASAKLGENDKVKTGSAEN